MADWIRVDDPGELIVAMPAMLGFVPERSLVIAVLRAGKPPCVTPVIDAVARFELEPPGGRRGMAARIAECLSRICAAEQADEVLAVIIDDRANEPGPRQANPRRMEQAAMHTALIVALDQCLAAYEVMLAGAWAVSAIHAGEHWWPLLGAPCGGVLPDPAQSSVAMSSVLDGRPIHASRSELTAVLAPDTELCEQVSAQVEAALENARERRVRAARHGEEDSYRRALLERVLWQVAHAESHVLPDAPEIAGLLPALQDPKVRSTLFALAYTEQATAVEKLWLRLVQALPLHYRADAATLLGYSAYVRGDGAFAGMALDVALESDPGYEMAGLLECGLRSGMRPGPLRRVGRSGHAMAADLGVDLGPLVESAEVSR
ncbi:uncharacterized protein DUF4192 [Nocardia tenerifensis]|uniref:Uncharacterized protein DUF4192 n=1 Tax=Nocardia tenerifensis TaxID=228006 RepID=A0A318JNR6_9NOCA|nr:DUF4192 domain-containing protein [Nocardia tenerifensis]PXX53422.1 uncharacterized protein DUF4192 [Nocardia tenerifensis]